ncbi:hypothetical protein IGI04_002963 [Brassica rapa subsp. trilocularis]|uniref:CCHC-type domain-containing protein n=1 Tax=Brassica rapa subsp. trilocularis TaxID=1813537 RepID=A0ABQ7NX03_BRACM|nr:hypothetical protein IGI04_002963 [Brassica rapa subsp. trilocularis]
MALNNQRRAPRHLALGLADPQIIVPETAYAEAQQNNRRSLIGRVLSPRRVDLHGLLDRLPLDWHADRSRLRGRIIGGGKFQFLLCYKKVVRFESGEVKVVSLSYEDIACNTARFRFCRNCGGLKHLKKSCTLVWVDVPDPNERALSPPPPDASFDGSAEDNGERGTSSGTLEGELEPAGEDVEHQQTQGLDGVDGGEGKQVQSEMVGTSAEGSKRKFEAVEEDDGVLEKRIRGSSNETEGLGVNPKPLGEE